MTHVPGHIPVRPFKLRRDVSDRWLRFNPVLSEGEPAIELDTGRFKIGDGVTPWSELVGFIPGEATGDNATLPEHVLSENPHPVYDDGRSFVTLYENAKV